MISAYSFVMSTVLFNLALVLVFLLRRKRHFIARYGIQVLALIVALGIVRLFSPVDGQFSYVIRSHKVIPAIQSALRYGVFGSRITVGKILLAVWAVGIVAYAVRDAVVLIRFRKLRSSYVPCDAPHIAELAKSLNLRSPLVVTPCVASPHIAGYLKPVIYVPPLELSDEDWNYVLKHEMQHLSAHDQQIKLLFLFLRTVFWWNPVSHGFIRELDAILELRCDDRVCAKLREEEQAAYFGAMLRVLRQIVCEDRGAASAVTGLVGGQSANRYNIKQRYEVYAGSNKRHGKAVRGAVIALICAVFVASYFVIVQPVYLPPEEEVEGAVIVAENTEAFIAFNGEKYVLFAGRERVMELSPDQMDDEPYCNFPLYDLRDYGFEE